MPNLDVLVELLRNLQGDAEQRPDLLAANEGGPSFGSPDYRAPGDYKVATFAGRVVRPGENAREVLSRFPTGELESGGQALGMLPAKLMAGAASKALMVPGGRFYHGTPNVFAEFDPAMTKSSGLVGPGVAYLTDNPRVAADYAAGATHGMGVNPSLPAAITAGMQPNIRPYLVKNHNAFVTNAPLGQADMESLLRGLRAFRESLNKTSGFQKYGTGGRAQNVERVIKSGVGQPGQATYKTLSDMLGPDLTNRLIKESGFKSIQYPGGVIMGDVQHRATNVLDSSIMQNLFDALSGLER